MDVYTVMQELLWAGYDREARELFYAKVAPMFTDLHRVVFIFNPKPLPEMEHVWERLQRKWQGENL